MSDDYAHRGHDLIDMPGDPTFCVTCGFDVMGRGQCGTTEEAPHE